MTEILKSRNFLILLLVLLLFSMKVDWEMVHDHGSLDLRNRVVGARLLKDGKDPYFYRWTYGEPSTYLDPVAGDGHSANRCTVTPAMLVIYGAFSDLPYPTQKTCWYLLQWTASLVLVALLLACLKDRSEKRALLALLVIGFLASECWRMHVERGQAYVFFALFPAIASWFICKKGESGAILAGFFIGIAIPLRPTLVVAGVPFLLGKHWKVVAGGILGACLSTSLFLYASGQEAWKSYAKAMNSHASYHLRMVPKPEKALTKLGDRKWPKLSTIDGVTDIGYAPSPQRLILFVREDSELDRIRREANKRIGTSLEKLGAQLEVRIRFPKKLEDSRNGYSMPEFRTGSSGFSQIFRKLPISDRLLFMKGLLLVSFSLYLILLRIRRRGSRSLELDLLTGVSLAVMVQFFLPAPRYVYMNIGWTVPLALLFRRWGWQAVFRGPQGLLLAAGLILANGILTPSWSDQALGDYAILLYFALTLLQLEPKVEELNS